MQKLFFNYFNINCYLKMSSSKRTQYSKRTQCLYFCTTLNQQCQHIVINTLETKKHKYYQYCSYHKKHLTNEDYKEKHKYEKPKECPICCEDNVKLLPLNPCRHWCCRDCITKSGEAQCPFCRTNLICTEKHLKEIIDVKNRMKKQIDQERINQDRHLAQSIQNQNNYQDTNYYGEYQEFIDRIDYHRTHSDTYLNRLVTQGERLEHKAWWVTRLSKVHDIRDYMNGMVNINMINFFCESNNLQTAMPLSQQFVLFIDNVNYVNGQEIMDGTQFIVLLPQSEINSLGVFRHEQYNPFHIIDPSFVYAKANMIFTEINGEFYVYVCFNNNSYGMRIAITV